MLKTTSQLLAELSKKHGIQLGTMSDVVKPVTGLTTGNLAIDHITGCGGIPVGRITELYGLPSSGKAQPLDALVLAASGYIKMSEVAVGTLLATPDGVWRPVVGVFPQGVQPVYRLTFSDGSSCEATDDHLWTIEVYVPYLGYIPATVTTAQLRHRMHVKRPRIRLPKVNPLAIEGTGSLAIHPYLLGLLLGDGGMTGRAVLFTTTDDELLDAVRMLVPLGCEVVPQTRKTASISWRINGIQEHLRHHGLMGLSSHTKYVPEEYKNQPAQIRLAVLQGLMDTDGHASSGTYNAGHGTAEFCSASRQLRDDVLWLARSLGLKAVCGKTKKTSYVDDAGQQVACKDSYRVRIYQTPEIRVFRLHRKLKPLAAGLHYNRELVSIEYTRDADCQCISLGAGAQLYVTDDFIPTHNTTTALQAAARLQAKIIDSIVRGGSPGPDGIRGGDLIVYFDYENTLDGEYAANLGLDVDHPSFVLAQPDFLEQGGEIGLDLIKTGDVKLSIWDSVASMTPLSTMEGDFDQRTSAMNRARLLNGMLMRFNGLLKHHSSAAIFLNHLTEAIDMGGRPGMPPRVDTPGGKALKFYSSLRLEYRQLKQVKGKAANALTNEDNAEQVIAQHIKVKVVKNKVAPMAFRECEVRSRFGSGFDNTWSAIQVLLDHKAIQKAGAWYAFDRQPALVHEDLPTVAGKRQLQGEPAIEEFARLRPEWRRALITAAVVLVDAYGLPPAHELDAEDTV